MKKITLEQLERCSHRKSILHSRLRELEDNISGNGVSYLPLILGSDKKTDPVKQDKFFDGLIESFKNYSELFRNVK